VTIHDLPHVNASLNAISAVLLICGYGFIRARRITAHRNCMIAAFIVSIVFLVSYVTYHSARQAREGVGHTKFAGTGPIATFYYGMLISHVSLAAIVPVLAIITLRRGLRDDRLRHRSIARWTLPIWLYVSVTGVLVYMMLYHWYAPVTAQTG
jgi:uncharacterized membrane protein YozB (DUF420 family)